MRTVDAAYYYRRSSVVCMCLNATEIAHASLLPKRHLDRFGRFCTAICVPIA